MRDAETAGRLISDARRVAGLTLAQLSGRCKVAVSTLSLYERGRKQPSFAMVTKILRACGKALQVTEAVPDAERKSEILAMVCAAALAMPDRGRKAPPPVASFRDLRPAG